MLLGWRPDQKTDKQLEPRFRATCRHPLVVIITDEKREGDRESLFFNLREIGRRRRRREEEVFCSSSYLKVRSAW